jgi:hypothetical protein
MINQATLENAISSVHALRRSVFADRYCKAFNRRSRGLTIDNFLRFLESLRAVREGDNKQ